MRATQQSRSRPSEQGRAPTNPGHPGGQRRRSCGHLLCGIYAFAVKAVLAGLGLQHTHPYKSDYVPAKA